MHELLKSKVTPGHTTASSSCPTPDFIFFLKYIYEVSLRQFGVLQ